MALLCRKKAANFGVSTKTDPRCIFIGDVHGQSRALDDLLNILSLTQEDTLIFLGDLVDKGPDPVGVVRRVGQLRDQADRIVLNLRGNHEDKHLRYRLRLQDSPKIARKMAESSPELLQFYAGASAYEWRVLETAIPFWRDRDAGLLAVHGGIPGNMKDFPDHWEDVQALPRHDQRFFEQIFRTRYLNPENGAFLANDHVKPGDPFWAALYDGRFGQVIFGHEPFFEGPKVYPHAIGIDTGAGHGGHLTALVFAGDTHHFESVPV